MEASTVSAYLDAKTLAELKKIAEHEQRSMSWMVGFAVKQMLAQRALTPALTAMVGRPPSSPGAARQIDLEEQIARAVEAGPVKALPKKAKRK